MDEEYYASYEVSDDLAELVRQWESAPLPKAHNGLFHIWVPPRYVAELKAKWLRN